jgi:hypothetical protein
LCNVVSAPNGFPHPYNAKDGKTMTPCRFASEPINDTNRKDPPVFPARNCDLQTQGVLVEICDAPATKTDIDWF